MVSIIFKIMAHKIAYLLSNL